MATTRDPRTYTQAEVIDLARRGKAHPASLTPAEIRAVALYWLSLQHSHERAGNT